MSCEIVQRSLPGSRSVNQGRAVSWRTARRHSAARLEEPDRVDTPPDEEPRDSDDIEDIIAEIESFVDQLEEIQ